MARYLISFDDGAMDFIPEEEMPAVGEAAHAVIRDAQDAPEMHPSRGLCVESTQSAVRSGASQFVLSQHKLRGRSPGRVAPA
jgi:hypothetical protein